MSKGNIVQETVPLKVRTASQPKWDRRTFSTMVLIYQGTDITYQILIKDNFEEKEISACEIAHCITAQAICIIELHRLDSCR